MGMQPRGMGWRGKTIQHYGFRPCTVEDDTNNWYHPGKVEFFPPGKRIISYTPKMASAARAWFELSTRTPSSHTETRLCNGRPPSRERLTLQSFGGKWLPSKQNCYLSTSRKVTRLHVHVSLLRFHNRLLPADISFVACVNDASRVSRSASSCGRYLFSLSMLSLQVN